MSLNEFPLLMYDFFFFFKVGMINLQVDGQEVKELGWG